MKKYGFVWLTLLFGILFANSVAAQRRKKNQEKDNWTKFIEVVQNLNKVNNLIYFEEIKSQRVASLIDTIESVKFKSIRLEGVRYLSSGPIEQMMSDSLLVLINNARKQVIASRFGGLRATTSSPLDFFKTDSLVRVFKNEWQITEESRHSDTTEYLVVKQLKGEEQRREESLRIVFNENTKDLLSLTVERGGYVVLDSESVNEARSQLGEQAVVKIGEVFAIKKVQIDHLRVIGKEKLLKNQEMYNTSWVLSLNNSEYRLQKTFADYELIIID